MSGEEERIAEVALPPVRVPAVLKEMIEEFQYVTLKGDRLKLYTTSDVMREALLKGIRLMAFERTILDSLVEAEAKNGALRLYASLKVPAEEKSQATAGSGEGLGKTEE